MLNCCPAIRAPLYYPHRLFQYSQVSRKNKTQRFFFFKKSHDYYAIKLFSAFFLSTKGWSATCYVEPISNYISAAARFEPCKKAQTLQWPRTRLMSSSHCRIETYFILQASQTTMGGISRALYTHHAFVSSSENLRDIWAPKKKKRGRKKKGS